MEVNALVRGVVVEMTLQRPVYGSHNTNIPDIAESQENKDVVPIIRTQPGRDTRCGSESFSNKFCTHVQSTTGPFISRPAKGHTPLPTHIRLFIQILNCNRTKPPPAIIPAVSTPREQRLSRVLCMG
jgi:hypothetical protein